MSAVKKSVLASVVVLFCLSPLFAQDKTTFPVAASTKTAGYSPLWAGVKQGFFAQQGLDVQPIVIRGSDRSIQALVGGSVYAALLAPDAPSPLTVAWTPPLSPATRSVWRIGSWAAKITNRSTISAAQLSEQLV